MILLFGKDAKTEKTLSLFVGIKNNTYLCNAIGSLDGDEKGNE